VPLRTPLPEHPRELSREDWRSLVELAHIDRRRAFQRYAEHYLATAGQVYWSDTHQLGVYLDDYHRRLDRRLRSRAPGSEVIGELFVPRAALPEFMAEAAAALRRRGVVVIYGTVRLIERDGESFLEWAREPYACVVFNLWYRHHVEMFGPSRANGVQERRARRYA
jgi:hypothetical protein